MRIADDTESYLKIMRVFLIAVLATTGMYAATVPTRAPRREIDNVTAFARLYGVVRYFYPTDAAASLDWNYFAVHGVHQARVAPNVKELTAALKELFGPLGHDRYRDYAVHIRDSGELLLKAAEDILAMARIHGD